MNKLNKPEVFNKKSTHPLQSSYWGNFREAWGNQVAYFPFGLITLHKIPFSKYKLGMFIKGPKITQCIIKILRDYGKKNSLIFIKLEPNQKKDDKTIKLLKQNRCVTGKTLFTPTTFWIDLTKSQEELLKSFSSKTRYNIRLAQRHGVVVQEDNSDRAFKKYLQLTRETVQRQHFFAHTQKYHELMWEYLHKIPVSQGKKPIAHLLVAKYKGRVITTWILFEWHNFLYYPYGASSDKYKNVMANNLMMWEAIKFGQKQGLETFDLWGREEGKGFTKFKEGYSPEIIEFIGTWDLIINKPLYTIYKNAESLRWKILRLGARLGLSRGGF